MLVNVRSLSKHALDIKYDQRLCINDVICLTEIQIKMNQSVQNDISCLPNSETYFNNGDNHYSSISYGHQISVSCSPKSDYEEFCISKVGKKGCRNMNFTLILIYKKISQPLRSFCDALEYLIQADSPRIIWVILILITNLKEICLQCFQIISSSWQTNSPWRCVARSCVCEKSSIKTIYCYMLWAFYLLLRSWCHSTRNFSWRCWFSYWRIRNIKLEFNCNKWLKVMAFEINKRNIGVPH